MTIELEQLACVVSEFGLQNIMRPLQTEQPFPKELDTNKPLCTLDRMARTEGTCWEGRTWISCDPTSVGEEPRRSFRLLSYNVLSDYKTSFLHYTNTKNWDIRSKNLLDEIKTYDIDIICLQDVDHYQDWWRPQLTLLGYDTIYKQRTQTKNFHYEGVLIAFRRDVFQMFKSHPFELNNAVLNDDRGRVFRERSKTDDVGVIVFLQPWSRDTINSAVCVCCSMLSDELDNSDIRMVQTNYIAHQVEVANMEFHVPIIMACSMYDIPSSLAYTVMSTGRIPLAGQVPKTCRPPHGHATCRSSVLLKWLPPASSLADFPILYYRISWRPGGSQVLAFRAQIEVGVGDCVKYVEASDAKGNIRMVAQPEREFTIAGLVSDVPYEFRVAAVNEVGQGVWSDVSVPIVMNNPDRAPEMPELRQFAYYNQLNETRELEKMQNDDRDACYTRRIDAMSSTTQLTPRNLDGDVNLQVARNRVLPYHINPRDGWKKSLHGNTDNRIHEALSKESVINKSVLRDHSGFKNKDLNHYIDLTGEGEFTTEVTSPIQKKGNNKLALEIARLRDKNMVLLDGREVLDAVGIPNKRQSHDLTLSSAYSGYSIGGEPHYTASMPSEKNKIGTECLDYVFYSTGTLVVNKLLSIPLLSEIRKGERGQVSHAREDVPFSQPPLISQLSYNQPILALDAQIGVQYTENSGDLLGTGSTGSSLNVDRNDVNEMKRLLRQALEKSRAAGNNSMGHAAAASTKQARFVPPSDGTPGENNTIPSSGLWGGKWAPFGVPNHHRPNYWLPSESFASSHVALGVEFTIDDQLLCTQWS